MLDVADAYVRAFEATQRGDERIYNVGTGNGVALTAILEAVEAITGRAVTTEHRPPRDEPQVLVADARRIHDDLGWTAPASGLERIISDAWAATRMPRPA